MTDQQQYQKAVVTSPKRFFRGFNSSPFKMGISPHSRNNSSSEQFQYDGQGQVGSAGHKGHSGQAGHLGGVDVVDSMSQGSSSFDFTVNSSPYMSPKNGSHRRSQSHDMVNHNKSNLSSPNWTQLIPPLPVSPSRGRAEEIYLGPKTSQNSCPLLNLGTGADSTSTKKSNRHTIAVSPNATMLIPDMLQPSTDLYAERSFVLTPEHNKSYTEVPFVESLSSKIPGVSGSSRDPGSSKVSGVSGVPGPSKASGASGVPGPPLQRPRIPRGVNSGQSLHGPVSSSEMLSQAPKAYHEGKEHHRNLSGQRSGKMTHTNVPPKTPPPIAQPQQTSLPRPHAPPPLISQASLKAVTILKPQDSSTSVTSGLEQGENDSLGSGSGPGLDSKKVQDTQNKTTLAHLQQKQRLPSVKKRKACSSCNLVISGQFVRALNRAYHIECFKCHKCGVLCSAKFFPHEIEDAECQKIQVPLCEYDYFTKLGLICHSCDSALRGPYITALGNKYHLEHFKCYACDKVFESDESYYEHENSVYCHFHYSRLFATKCEGCHSSIVKQFVELFKSGKLQQWHPECYMVYKFWNVSVTMDAVGLPLRISMANMESGSSSKPDVSANDLLMTEQRVEAAVMNCWVALSGFEEAAASRISEMLLAACSGKRMAGLATTGRLILYLEVLFKGLDYVQNMCLDFKPDDVSVSEPKRALIEEIYSVDAFDKFQTLRKEPRNISGKLMSYLAILRKSYHIAESGSLSSELLAVITGCAHYLKLLIRIGLTNALTLNKLRGDTKALDGFLHLVKTYEDIDVAENAREGTNFMASQLAVPPTSTDACFACSKSIEKSCVVLENMRWHHKCFACSRCHRKPSADLTLESFLTGPKDMVLCCECVKLDKSSTIYTQGFVKVSDLSQLLYLLKIALTRSKFAIKKETTTVGSQDKSKALMKHIEEEPTETEAKYSKTLDEVTSLRKKRESRTLRNSVKQNVRKSVVLEAPKAVAAKPDNTSIESDERKPSNRKGSTSSAMSFTVSRRDSDIFDFHTNSLKIRDDPPNRMTINSLDRTSDLLKNEKSLTLDDIPRIVAAEQARDQRPNAFKHHNSLYQKRNQPIKSVSNNDIAREPSQIMMGGREGAHTKHKYFSELTKQEHSVLRHIAVEAFLSINNQFTREELSALVETKKSSTFWEKFKFGGGTDKGKSHTVFGVELHEVCKRYGVDTSLGVGPSQVRIPMLVEDIILALRQKDMSVEGIFRLNGNIKNLRELTEQINAAPMKSPNYSNYSAVQLAALMKKWLRELPNPLLTFNLYDLWISSSREQNPAKTKRILQLAYCMLPRSNRNLLEVLLYFFSWVASFAEIDEETGSKMDTHNLATVLAPNILYSKEASGENGENQSSDAHFLAIEVVNQLIEIHEDLAVIPNDLWEFYEKCQFNALVKSDSTASKELSGRSNSISTKDVISKISKASKESPDYFVAFVKKDSYLEPRHHNTIRSGQAKLHDGEKPR